MQQWVYQTNVHDLDELKQRLIDVWHGLGQNIIDDANEWRRHVFVPKDDILSICLDSRART